MNTKAEQFFYNNAGFSFDPKTETATDGHWLCARALARAEAAACAAGWSFEWEIDPITDSSDFSDDPEPWAQWVCSCHDQYGEILASLCGIDFGRDGKPWSNPYRRVVEAELALEATIEEEQAA